MPDILFYRCKKQQFIPSLFFYIYFLNGKKPVFKPRAERVEPEMEDAAVVLREGLTGRNDLLDQRAVIGQIGDGG